MGCTNGSNTNENIHPNIQPVQEVNIVFKLSSGEEYNIQAKENEKFQTVLHKFIEEHQEINNKTINALYNNNKVDLFKTVSENNIQANNLILLNIEEPENPLQKSYDYEDLSMKYNPENVIWIDENVDNFENTGYLKGLNSLGYNVNTFKNVDDGLEFVKTIKFESTKIIISGRLYVKFIRKFIDDMNEIFVIPKIIIFTLHKDLFIKYNKPNEDIINHPFFSYGGIRVVINDIVQFLKDEITQNRVKKDKPTKFENTEEFYENRIKMKDNAKLTFEHIDSNQKLALPLFYKALIEKAPTDNIENYTQLLYTKYADASLKIKELLNPIKTMEDIPIELLSKYYARIYTIDSDFYRDINRELREKQAKKYEYLPFIKVLYDGVKLQALSIANDTELYRGSIISNLEIELIRKCLADKKPNLPGVIVFSKSFLSFSKERSVAEGFLSKSKELPDFYKILYILEKDENTDYASSTHSDLEDISYYNNEKEVLFFPFSPFEIKGIQEFKEENRYEVRLLYLGKYLKEIEKDFNLIDKENDIPDSEFKKQIIDLGLIPENKIKNTKQIFIDFKNFKDSVENKGFKKFKVKDVELPPPNIIEIAPPQNLFESYNEVISSKAEKYKTNILTRSYNRSNSFNKNELSESQVIKNKKTLKFDESFSITKIEDEKYEIKVININLPNFLSEYLIPIWFEQDKYIKFKAEGKYRINENSAYHDSLGMPSTKKFNYGAVIARIGSGEPFVLPSKEFIYLTKTDGPLYLKINLPKNMKIKPEGKLKINVYDGKLMTRKEIYDKIGWKQKELKYANKKAKLSENDLTVFLNQLRMNPTLFYDSIIIKDDKLNKNKNWMAKFLENMKKNNDLNEIKAFQVNNRLYELIRSYLSFKSENLKKELTLQNSTKYLEDLQGLLQLNLEEKLSKEIIVNCKLIKKKDIQHICIQFLYDKEIVKYIFDKEYNSISVNIKEDIFEDFYLIILAITKVENDDNNQENKEKEEEDEK